MLDEQSIKAAEANMILKRSKFMVFSICLDYPGGRVPEWFMYRSNQSSITVDLSSIPQPWDGSFFLCAIISTSGSWMDLSVNCFIDGQQACPPFKHHLYGPRFGPILSDHVFLWCDRHNCREVQRKIEENTTEMKGNTYHPLLQIQFTLSSYPEGGSAKIKECGACPTSALQYHNYIQQIHLAMQWGRHLKSPNITTLMSLENLIPSLKTLMLLQNLILSFKSLMSLRNLAWSLKARRNMKNLILSVKAIMILRNFIPSLKALRNLKNLILFLEAFMNLKNLNLCWGNFMNSKNFTVFDEQDKEF